MSLEVLNCISNNLSTSEILRTNFVGDFHPLYDEMTMDPDSAAKRQEIRAKKAAEEATKVSVKKPIPTKSKRPSQPPTPAPSPPTSPAVPAVETPPSTQN